jgi:hypothetical protein
MFNIMKSLMMIAPCLSPQIQKEMICSHHKLTILAAEDTFPALTLVLNKKP